MLHSYAVRGRHGLKRRCTRVFSSPTIVALGLFTDIIRRKNNEHIARNVQILAIEGEQDLTNSILLQILLARLPNIVWYRILHLAHSKDTRATKFSLPTSYNSKLKRLTVEIQLPFPGSYVRDDPEAPSTSALFFHGDIKLLPPSLGRLDLLSVDLTRMSRLAIRNLKTFSLNEATLYTMRSDFRLKMPALVNLHLCDLERMAEKWQRISRPLREQFQEIHVHCPPVPSVLTAAEDWIHAQRTYYARHVKFYLDGTLVEQL